MFEAANHIYAKIFISVEKAARILLHLCCGIGIKYENRRWKSTTNSIASTKGDFYVSHINAIDYPSDPHARFPKEKKIRAPLL